jgi:hypothetical protein
MAKKKTARKKAAPKKKATPKKRTVRKAAPKKKASTKKRRVIKVMKQTGKKSNRKADGRFKALPPGKRRSKTGKIYTETRKNRTDVIGLAI